MKVNFYVTCIADAVRADVGIACVQLLQRLGCEIVFLEKQCCCGQPALNSGFAKDALPGLKHNIETFEANDYPIVGPAGSCIAAIKKYPHYLADEPEWAERAQRVADRFYELTDFLVNQLKVTDVGAKLEGTAVYHPSCSVSRKLGLVQEPLTLLQNVKGLKLLPITNQTTCCGFGGTFSIKMATLSGEIVQEKANNIMAANPDYLIGADVSCLINIGGRLSRVKSPIKVMHIAQVLNSGVAE